MADAQTTFGGEVRGEEAAETAGSSLAPRPVRAESNDQSAWRAPRCVVADSAEEGISMRRVSMDEALGGSV